jgi:hypothetical protein
LPGLGRQAANLGNHELQGRHGHRDIFFSAAEEHAADCPCSCFSRLCRGGIVIDSSFRPDPPCGDAEAA